MDGKAGIQEVTTEGPMRVIHASPGAPLTGVDAVALKADYCESGAVLLRGFSYDVEAFRLFAEGLCSASVFNESRNRALLDKSSNIQSVDLGTAPFPLHPELSREPWRPDVCLFACFAPPLRGGETTICDGVEIVRRLPPTIVDDMLEHSLVYCQPALPEALKFWLGTETPSAQQLAAPPPECPYSFKDLGDRIIRCFARPVLHKPMFHDGPAFGNFILFARLALRVRHFPLLDDGSEVPDAWVEAVERAAAPITYPVQWRQGDLLVLDNSRFMHGRNHILKAAERKIASYFGYLSFAPISEFDPPNPLWRQGSFRPPAPVPGLRRPGTLPQT